MPKESKLGKYEFFNRLANIIQTNLFNQKCNDFSIMLERISFYFHKRGNVQIKLKYTYIFDYSSFPFKIRHWKE